MSQTAEPTRSSPLGRSACCCCTGRRNLDNPFRHLAASAVTEAEQWRMPLTGRYVMSPAYFVSTASAVKSRPTRSGAFRGRVLEGDAVLATQT